MGSVPANDRSVRAVAAVRYRLAQAWAHVATPPHPIDLPPALARLLKGGILDTFRALPAADQQHLVTVASLLAEAGWDDDVVTAGLLHDIGKVVPGTRISLLDRGLWVILQRTVPSLAKRLAALPHRPWVGTGVWALSRHAESGAAMLAATGYNHQVCWLVWHHERRDINDPGLRALLAADNARQPVGTAAVS